MSRRSIRSFKRSFKTSVGITLLELVVSISIAAILLALAVPSFQKQVQHSAQRSLVADFITAMAYARAESVKRGDEVFLRTVSATHSWVAGWCVTTDSACGNNDIRRFDAVDSVSFLSTDKTTKAFTFNSQGFLESSSASVSICQTDKKGKKITVTPLGQALAQDCTCDDQSICG